MAFQFNDIILSSHTTVTREQLMMFSSPDFYTVTSTLIVDFPPGKFLSDAIPLFWPSSPEIKGTIRGFLE